MAWNGSDNKVKDGGEGEQRRGRFLHSSLNTHHSSLKHGLLAGLTVVALASAALWWFVGRTPDDSNDPTTHQSDNPPIAEVAPAKKPYVAPVKRTVEKTGDKLKDALAEVEAQGELVKIDPREEPAEEKPTRPATKRTFKTGAEQLMGWLVSVEPGDMPIPIPPFSDSDKAKLAEILISKNEVGEEDSERIATLKQEVDYFKKEMMKFIKDGGDPNDFMQYYFQQLKSAFETRNMVADQYEDLKENDPDLARDFLKQANKLLDDKGIKNIRDVEAEEESEISEQNEPQQEESK